MRTVKWHVSCDVSKDPYYNQILIFKNARNPNTPTPLGVTWPLYTADREEYLGLSPNLTVRFKMRAAKMAFWNELLPSIAETLKPTTSDHIPTTSAKAEDGKGINYVTLS